MKDAKVTDLKNEALYLSSEWIVVKPFSCSFASVPQSFYHVLSIFLPVRGAYSFHSFPNGLPRVSISDK